MSLKDHTVIIALGNKARHGKDTAANVMVNEFSKLYDIRKYGFGVQLKEEVNQFDQFEFCVKNGIQYDTNPDMTDPLCQTKHGKQVKLLQWYGQHKRELDKLYWVKRLDAKLKKEKPQIAVISDLRYKNEMMWVKSHGGYTIRVMRQGFVDLSRDPKHISEIDLDDAVFDYEIHVPEGAVDQLKSDAIEVFNYIIAAETPRVDDIEELNNAYSS